jgi:hypothetical protein
VALLPKNWFPRDHRIQRPTQQQAERLEAFEMTYFAITGRAHGDAEDYCMLFECDTVEQARQAFIVETRRTAGITEADVEEGDEYSNVYITTVLSSQTPIEVL